jgi:4-hydroxy-4-methyl-2-oxoglutarate aldolase
MKTLVVGNIEPADEGGKRRQLAAGALGLDMYSIREPLKKAGLIHFDEPLSD